LRKTQTAHQKKKKKKKKKILHTMSKFENVLKAQKVRNKNEFSFLSPLLFVLELCKELLLSLSLSLFVYSLIPFSFII